MLTSLYLMTVLPASMPCATGNTMVIVGPSLMMRCTAMPMATAAARMGITHTTEIRPRRRRSTVAWGRDERSLSSAMAAFRGTARIPDQTGVERVGGEHRQHDHRDEEDHARAGQDG